MKKLDKKNIFDIYPLTEGQQGILFETIKDPNDQVYSIQIFIGYDFLLDEGKFRNAWDRVLEDNEILRSVIRWKKINEPIAIILKDASDRIDILKNENILFQDFQSFTEAFCKPDLNIEDEVFKITLHQINNSKSLLEIQSHHIIQDGWSTAILINEFIDHYLQKDQGYEKANYKKCISCLKEYTEFPLAKKYWEDYLEDFESQSLLGNYENESLPIEGFDTSYNSEYLDLLKTKAREHKVSLSTILHLGWAIALRDHQDTDDVLFGTVVAGRPSSIRGLDRMMGNFINTLPFRVRFDNQLTVKETLQQVQKNIAAHTDFELCTMGQIKKFAKLASDAEIFDSVLVIENYPFDETVLYADPLKASYTQVKESSSYPLDISIRVGKEIQINTKYQPAKIAEDSVRFLITSFKEALDFILQSEGQSVGEYTGITEAEKRQILHDFNEPVNEKILPAPSIIELLDTEVVKSSENTALVAGGVTITYHQLFKDANKLAHKLKQKGVLPGEIIGLYASHAVERIISLLAILKVGGAFLPLRVSEPLEILSENLDSCAVTKLLVEAKYSEVFYNHPSFSQKLFIDTNTSEIEDDFEWKNHPTKKSDLAYVMMTSGSTGTPKAVAVEHRSLQNTIHWFMSEYNLNNNAKILQLTDYTFDPSLEDIFGGLLVGGEIHLPSKDLVTDAQECYDYMVEQKITLVNYVPTVLYEILGNREKIESLQTVISGGEALSETIKEELISNGYNLFNNYGPTEITVDCLYSRCDQRKVNLGKSISNSYCLILDSKNHLTPIGRPGEICIGGLGVARGYLNDPVLTARKFISDPYHSGRILYKTGDYGIWQADGTILYLGRKDNQVKINGIRVELGQIKSEISKMPEIIQSEVIVTDSAKRLIAFCVLRKGQELSEDKVKELLRKTLPAYMIPKSVCFLEKFPLTSNGKTDTGSLEKIYVKTRSNGASTWPKNVSIYERDLVNIWCEILDLEKLDMNMSFFDLGGDSLGLMKVNNRINDHFDLDLPISTYFSYSSIKLLGMHIQDLRAQGGMMTLEAPSISSESVSATKNRLLTIKRNR